ncbi:MAG: hypothetical protein KDC34_16940 [Saprospiraceae bacterium]|nr:hypothetical protein [Saprospiraceae bacterium]
MVRLYKTKCKQKGFKPCIERHIKAKRKDLLSISFLFLALSLLGQDQSAPDFSSESITPPSTITSDQQGPGLNQLSTPNETIQGIQYDSSFLDAKLRKKDQSLIIFGYYRLFLYGRNMVEPYPNLSPYERAYGVGDGYREPMMSVSVIGRPNGKSTFGTELFLYAPYLGTGSEDNVFTMNLGLNFYGNFRTKHGNFGVRAGGIHWYNLSSFTIGVFQILDRFSIFDRTPWEGVTNTDKYNNYFETGATSPGDLRWNNQAFQGLIINGGKLPGDFAFDLFWGKTQPNGGLSGGIIDPYASIPATLDAGNVPNYLGFNGTSRVIPSILTGGKLSRSFGKKHQTFSYNMIYSHTALDSLTTPDSLTQVSDWTRPARSYQVHSLGLDLKLAKIKLTGELAMGSYESPTYEKKWGEALMLRFLIPEDYTYLPFDIQVYQISKNFFNQNGEIATNSNPDILKDQGLVAGANGVGGQMALVNQLVHNRRGVNINTGIEVGPAKFNIGWGISEEIDPTSTQLTYVHRINGLALSRIYNPFPANATGPTIFGPYGRQISFFRGVSELVQTTDLNAGTAEAQNKKYFNAVDLQGKLKLQIMGRPLYFFYLGSLGSAKAKLSAIPSMDTDSYLFVQYHEFDLYYELFPNFVLTGYLGLENARGGQFTDWDLETQLPRDQHGRGIGVGFDWTIAENAGIYFRHRWMSFEDRSFSLDTYKGREVTIELKTFF